MIDLNEFAKEVHANAVAHGWYDGGERTEAEIFANIHSEWSEAFDAYAHGLPWYYHHCGDPATKDRICEDFADCYSRKIGWEGDHCFMRNKKPEGIAVELIDGVIRILDFVGYKNEKLNDMHKITLQEFPSSNEKYDETFCEMICGLHLNTADALCYAKEDLNWECTLFLDAIIARVALSVREQGLDPEKIMLEKHEYNKTRPYRHGGKVV